MGIKTEGSRARIVGRAHGRRVCSSRSLGALGCDAQWRSSRGLPAVATLGARRRLTLAARLAPRAVSPGCTGDWASADPPRQPLSAIAPRAHADTARLLPTLLLHPTASAECSVPLGHCFVCVYFDTLYLWQITFCRWSSACIVPISHRTKN